MRCADRHVVVIGLILGIIGCTSTPQIERTAGWEERREIAHQRASEDVAFTCVEAPEVSYLMLFYTPWDRWDYLPVPMPGLERDFLRNAVRNSQRFAAYPELENTLMGEVNELVNAELSRIADGAFNAIYVRVDDRLDLGIAPAGNNQLHMWIPEEDAEPGDEAEVASSGALGSPTYELWVLDIRGDVLDHLGAAEISQMAQEAAYQQTWQPWNDPIKFWHRQSEGSATGPRGRNERWGSPGFWTYAAWPPQVHFQQVRRCKTIEHKTIRH